MLCVFLNSFPVRRVFIAGFKTAIGQTSLQVIGDYPRFGVVGIHEVSGNALSGHFGEEGKQIACLQKTGAANFTLRRSQIKLQFAPSFVTNSNRFRFLVGEGEVRQRFANPECDWGADLGFVRRVFHNYDGSSSPVASAIASESTMPRARNGYKRQKSEKQPPPHAIPPPSGGFSLSGTQTQSIMVMLQAAPFN
jgi:hypothetical protein